MKYYREMNDEMCYPLKHFKSDKQFEGALLELQERDLGVSHFYCSEFMEVGETSEGCGNDCIKYQPRNKKSGRCRFHKNTFVGTDKFFRLEKNKLISITKREFENETD